MTNLSAGAVRVLQDIHARGLLVLWSYGAPNPYYDDADQTPMSEPDWHIVRTELGHTVIKSQYVVTGKQRKITRESARNGLIVTERILVAIDGSEMIAESVSDSPPIPIPDGVLNETIETTNIGHWASCVEWVSDYLIGERVEQDDYTEEFIGILHRYTLSPKALELISEHV